MAVQSASALEDPLLLGTLLADRYLGRHHRSTPNELADWLTRYRDLPDAIAVHALLVTKLPEGATPPTAPEASALGRAADPYPAPDDLDLPRTDLARDVILDRNVIDRAQRGDTSSALRLIAAASNLSPAYTAQLRAEVAQILFIRNDDAGALRVAQAALNVAATAAQPSLAFYIGGLAAWRLDRIELARGLFGAGATAPRTSAHLHAASAFWASRASRRLQDASATVKWLQVAAEQRLTLHGLLARRILRMDTGILPSGELTSGELVSQADVDAVAATQAGLRAFALLQVAQPDRAEAELRGLWSKAQADPVFGRSLMMVTAAVGLPDCAAQMASALQSQDGRRHDELRFAIPTLRPAGGFSIDPALVYALTRLESNFDTKSISPAGARGLMQIMPATAQYITGNSFYAPARLHDPASNLEIGQRYVAYLSHLDGIDNDLMRMLASYNSGPGSFLRWSSEIRDDGDPLLFVEAVPVAETRAFVTHALVYSWIYAARMHLPAPSLDDLAAGEFPRFTPPAHGRRMALLTPGFH
ncbi:MAG TPA: lytic transglycosylase domain-containing protein [Rhodopila sp.]